MKQATFVTHSLPTSDKLTLASTIRLKDAPPSSRTFDAELLEELQTGQTLERLKAIFKIVKLAESDQAIRLGEVLEMLGIKKSTWYSRLNPKSPYFDSEAPQPFKMGTSAQSASVWWRSDITAYLNARAQSRAGK
jgi:predicted DNA-binding transcriptional regulator AlpA